MEQKHFFIGYEYTPHMCNPFKGNAVISEEPADVWKRTLEHIAKEAIGDVFVITNSHEIDVATYRRVKKHNPTIEEYIRLSEKDAVE